MLNVLVVLGLAHTFWATQIDSSISGEQAIHSVRNFIGDPAAPVTVEKLRVEEPWSRRESRYYLRVNETHPWAGIYGVRPTDGTVISMTRRYPERKFNEPPTLSLEEAYNIAVNFARQHYPPFTRRRWQHESFRYSRNADVYDFAWWEVLNSLGVLGPDFLSITVNGITGDIVGYVVPPERPSTGPTVPRIGYQQAFQIASRYAFFDPNSLLFEEVTLHLG